MEKYLLIGLGNIGAEYMHTRHNIGFDVLDAFVKEQGGFFKIERLAEVAEVKLKGRSITCIKPTTYMNLSGKAFKYWLDKTHVDIKNTLTIVDDLALPLETLRLRPGGSHAGHNGLKDIQATIGTADYSKLRFGIGNQFAKGQQANFVLGKWQVSEMPIVNQKINACIKVLEDVILIGLEKTMNQVNQMKFL